jgi:putative ABC transport system permease protein
MTGRRREILARILGLISRRQPESDLEEEIAAHIELATEENLRKGMSREQARRATEIQFGNRATAREKVYEQRGLAGLESLLGDFVYAFRGLRKSPGFTAIAIAILAIGIGINAAVFTVTKAALFAGFPMVAHNDRLLYLSSGRGCCVSYPDFLDWRAQARSFQGMAIVHGVSGILSDASGQGGDTGFPESYDATEISADTFRVVGEKPLLGRDFVPADEARGASGVAILSYGFWERRFAKDPSVVSRRIRLNGLPATVVGIMPRGFSFPQKEDLWIPLAQTPELLANRQDRGQWFAFGRLAEGVTIQMARAEMETVGRRLGDAYPRTNQGRNLLPHVQTFNQFFIFENENAVYWSLWGAVAFVLLIACANLANLTFARAMERSREISVRIALGAGRWRIVRQLLAESFLVTGAGALLGLLIAQWGVRAYAAADRGPGRSSWRILDYGMDYRVFAYLVAISAGTALILAFAPMRRLSKLDIGASLKEGERGAAGGRRASRLSALLVTAEIALAVLLLAGAGVMTRSFLNLYTADLGVKTASVLTISVGLPQKDYPDANSRISFFDRAHTAFQAIPGVASVALASSIPTNGAARTTAELPDDAPGDQRHPAVFLLTIGPDYFQTLGTALASGRDFNDADEPSTIPVAIVNEHLAREYWPGENPLGKRLRLADTGWLAVIGVAPDISQNGAIHRGRDALVYLSYRQKPMPGTTILALTRVPPETLARAFRQEMQTLDSRATVYGPVTLDERLRSNYWTNGLYGVLFAIFAAVALVMASVGLFAVIAQSVARRTREIGIRMAIGASQRDIRAMVLRQGMVPMGIGLVIGLAGSLAVNRVLRSALVQVSPEDPAALAGAAALLVLAATLGCLIPARRAARTDPMSAIRHE